VCDIDLKVHRFRNGNSSTAGGVVHDDRDEDDSADIEGDDETLATAIDTVPGVLGVLGVADVLGVAGVAGVAIVPRSIAPPR
jgi:hypothetical protein